MHWLVICHTVDAHHRAGMTVEKISSFKFINSGPVLRYKWSIGYGIQWKFLIPILLFILLRDLLLLMMKLWIHVSAKGEIWGRSSSDGAQTICISITGSRIAFNPSGIHVTWVIVMTVITIVIYTTIIIIIIAAISNAITITMFRLQSQKCFKLANLALQL